MSTPQWIKKLGGHAGELYVAAELSKRGILNALLPENFAEDDLLIGQKDGPVTASIQVKACHPDRASTFILRSTHERWVDAPENQFVAFVWLGSPKRNEPPQYWLAPKRAVGALCVAHPAHSTHNWERRFAPSALPSEWRENWGLLAAYGPAPAAAVPGRPATRKTARQAPANRRRTRS